MGKNTFLRIPGWLIVLTRSRLESDRAVMVDRLPATAKQPELGYVLKVFVQGETLDAVSVPASWVTLLPDVWGQTGGAAIKAS